MNPFVFNTVPSIVFGQGTLARIGDLAARHLGPRVLLVTDQRLLAAGIVKAALDALARSGIAASVFADVTADPPEACVMAAVAMAKSGGATGVIGLGGGSPMDVAKLAALLACSGETLVDVYGVGNAKGPRLPLILVPTTAGTGSEVTPISIVTTGEAEKKGIVSPVILPDVALLDPDLTVGLPPDVTAATGIDAMVHAIEALTSLSANNNPVSRVLARQALALLGCHIRKAVTNGADIEARAGMMLGAMLAGQAFANSPVAAVHALAYPIGGIYHVPHGLSNALVLPAVIRFNASACGQAYGEVASIVFPDLVSLPAEERSQALAGAMAGLSAELGLQQRLRDVGIPADAIAHLAGEAMKQTRLLVNNPRSLDEAQIRAIYESVW